MFLLPRTCPSNYKQRVGGVARGRSPEEAVGLTV
jgi:hypothetical protein